MLHYLCLELVNQIIRFSTEYQIMIFGYQPNINYLPNIIWLNRISTIRLQPWFIAFDDISQHEKFNLVSM